jgi:hypothetical protein
MVKLIISQTYKRLRVLGLTSGRSCSGPCAATIANSPGVMVLASSARDDPRSLASEGLLVLFPGLKRALSVLCGLSRYLRLGTAWGAAYAS